MTVTVTTPLKHMHACKCQLFTDEGSRRLPKRLNYCFSVLASATNRSIINSDVADFTYQYKVMVYNILTTKASLKVFLRLIPGKGE